MKPIRFLEKYRIIPIVITLLLASFIFYMSSKTFQGSGIYNPINAIIYHGGIFFLLSLFLTISLVKGKHKNLIPLALVFSILYAFSDEFHQMFVPGRDSSLFDVLTDSTGALLASVAYLLTLKKN